MAARRECKNVSLSGLQTADSGPLARQAGEFSDSKTVFFTE
jgi:hypothetical protein